MTLELLPASIRTTFECHEWKHACAILKFDFPNEWRDLIGVLQNFELGKSWLTVRGVSKSKVAGSIDSQFYDRGWKEKGFSTSFQVDDRVSQTPRTALIVSKIRSLSKLNRTTKTRSTTEI